MKRWLCLDLGDKRIGVALSDPLGYTAQPLPVIPSKGTLKDIEVFGQLVAKYGVNQVVVGLPLNMDGTDSSRTKKVRLAASKMARHLPVPVVMVDERLTSWQAAEDLKEMGARPSARKKNIDAVAACLILRSALDGAELVPAERRS